MREVTLYHGLASTCSKKVRIALYEKGVAFESRLLDLQNFEQHEPEYLAINPNGVVPALVHDGHPVIESSIIAQYVDEAFDGPLLSPGDPLDRAQMRIWIRFSDEAAYPSVVAPTWQFLSRRAEKRLAEGGSEMLDKIPTAERRARWDKMAKGGYSEAEIDSAFARMEDCLDRLERRLGESLWLAGADFSLAEAAVLPFVVRMRNLRPSLVAAESRPSVADWLDRAYQRPSVGRAIDFREDPRAADLPNI